MHQRGQWDYRTRLCSWYVLFRYTAKAEATSVISDNGVIARRGCFSLCLSVVFAIVLVPIRIRNPLDMPSLYDA